MLTRPMGSPFTSSFRGREEHVVPPTQHTSAPRHRRLRAVACIAGAVALTSAVVPAAAAAAHQPAGTSQVMHVTGGQVALHRVGTVNLQALARADARKA